ncbi:MAG TPA: hypothetical protein VGO45_02085, partial [Bacteroidia bacterium]|nr:hypothetical protein [Bacteroidia bacterium]
MKKKYSLSLLGFILLLVLPLEKGRCASYVVCASGNWSTPATFKVGVGCPGGASAPAQPLAADDIIVSSGTLTIDAAATPTCHNITINAGAILTFAVSSGLTFNITGTLTIIGSLTFPAGYAGIVNVTGNIVNSGTVSRTNLTNGTGTINLTGSLSQSAGSFSLFATAARNLDLVFTGAGNVTVTSTGGTFTISDIGINKSTKATVVDIQSDAFITGINTAAVFNFTLTTGTLKINNGAAGGTALTNMHNGAGAAALTIPYNVVLESDASTTTTLSKSGQTTLNGELFINGGTVNHSTTSKKDLIYVEAG